MCAITPAVEQALVERLTLLDDALSFHNFQAVAPLLFLNKLSEQDALAAFSVLDTETTGVISLSQLLVGLPRLKEKKANSKPPPILIWYFSLNPSGDTISKVKEAAERAIG